MSDIGEAISEAVESAGESKLNAVIALAVAIIATLMALGGIKGGNIGQAMAQAQSDAVDTWAQYQSKSTKQNIAEALTVQLTAQRDLASTLTPEQKANIDQLIAKYTSEVARYKGEKSELEKAAKAKQQEYEALNVHDDQFDLSDAAFSVAIAILGVTALTQKRWLLWFGLLFAVFGLVFWTAGFFNLGLHPESLTGIFS
ncbi:MAG: DUF4337 domain-containing protein [Acidobacteria bacterium]|nr:DUF4337 domain-containing protein [Acidobacteriota bacterium]